MAAKKESEVSRLKTDKKILEAAIEEYEKTLTSRNQFISIIASILGLRDYDRAEIISKIVTLHGSNKKEEGRLQIEYSVIERLNNIIEAQIEPRILLKKYDNNRERR